MPNNEMDYSLIHRTPDGNGKILVTTPGSPDKGSWETEAELKTYVNQDVNIAINAINTRVTNIEDTLMGENEVTVQYPDDGNYSSLMPNKVPSRALKFAEVPKLMGKTRAWNQLTGNLTVSSINNLTVSYNTTTGRLQVSGTASDNTNLKLIDVSSYPDLSHKYLVLGIPSGSAVNSYGGYFATSGDWVTSDSIINGLTLKGSYNIRIASGVTVNIDCYPIFRDLTLIFGAGNEPSTVADALAQLPALGQYNAYDAGSLVDTVVSGVKSVGVNIWNEQPQIGALYSDGSENNTVTNQLRSDYITVLRSTSYYIKSSNGYAVYVRFYDVDKKPIGSTWNYQNIKNTSFDTDANTVYIRFLLLDVYGTTYNHDIQICLNSYTYKTTYHPYKTDTLSLPETVTLRSAGSVADTDELNVEVNGVAKRRKTVRVATTTLNDAMFGWTKGSAIYDGNGYVYYCAGSLFQSTFGITTCKYIQMASIGEGWESLHLYEMYSGGGYLALASPESNLSDFLSNAQNVSVNYSVASPSVTLSDPIPDNTIYTEGGGTVETIQTQTPVIDNCLDVTYDIIPQ